MLGSGVSESKKSVTFEPSLACHRLRWAVYSTDSRCYWCFVDPDYFEPDFCHIQQKIKNKIWYIFLIFGLDSISTNFIKIRGGAKMTIFKKELIWTVPLKITVDSKLN